MKRFALIMAFCASLLLLCSCGAHDKPPENGTPEPSPLSGDYAGEYGELSFNGDGRSISFELEHGFAEAAGLPDSGDGEYCFTFGGKEYRYDLAERIEITCGGYTTLISNKHGETCEDVIVLLHPESFEEVRFERGALNE